MGTFPGIRPLFFVFTVFFITTEGHFSYAQQDAPTVDEQEQLIKLLQLTNKELMIKQGLAEVPLSEEQLKTIDEQGYIDQVTETGVVISSLGNEVNCYLKTRYLLDEDSHYDEERNILLGSFHPDNNSSNTICRNFIAVPETLQCTVNENGATEPVADDQLAEYQQLCRDQVTILLQSSGS